MLVPAAQPRPLISTASLEAIAGLPADAGIMLADGLLKVSVQSSKSIQTALGRMIRLRVVASAVGSNFGT